MAQVNLHKKRHVNIPYFSGGASFQPGYLQGWALAPQSFVCTSTLEMAVAVSHLGLPSALAAAPSRLVPASGCNFAVAAQDQICDAKTMLLANSRETLVDCVV